MLLFGVIQCVALCAAGDLSPTLPPCHQHPAPSRAVSAGCTLDFLVPDVQSSSFSHLVASGFAAPAVEDAPLFRVIEIFTSPAFSPPSSSVFPSNILRL
jgi:hypothetical protein